MKTIAVCSIYPLRVGIERPLLTPENQFWLEPVDRLGGEKDVQPFVLTVNEQYQLERLPITGIEHKVTIGAEEIANDLVIHATQMAPGMKPECRPGVWIPEDGKTWVNRELETNLQAQLNWMDLQYNAGSQLALTPEGKKAITRLMRVSAKYLGRNPEWILPTTAADVKECQWCTKMIPAKAVVCPSCNQIVDFERYAQLEAIKKATLKGIRPEAIPA